MNRYRSNEIGRQKMADVVYRGHAGEDVKYYATHTYVFLGLSLKNIGVLFHKGPSTIYEWVRRWRDYVSLHRLTSKNNMKFGEEHKRFIKKFVDERPLSYLHEIRDAFMAYFNGMTISISTVYSILVNDLKYSKKKVERRALEIRFSDICRYSKEINLLRPLHHQLIFLDEVSFNNKDMLRNRGWFLRGSVPEYHGQFKRLERISLLAFLGCDGLLDAFRTEGTFTRLKFFDCVKAMVDNGAIKQGSIFIMDNASIHLDRNIVNFLRSVGARVVFLPAYSPFYNPIEVMFGYLKQDLREQYRELRPKRKGEEIMLLNGILTTYKKRDFRKTFKKCGYAADGTFNPFKNYDHDKAKRNCETSNFDILLENER